MSSQYEKDYISLIQKIMKSEIRETRAGKTRSIFGNCLTIDSLRFGDFPLLSGRQLYYKGVFGELAAMLKGPQHISDFTRQGCNYWSDWADPDGSLRLDYGNAWLDFNGVNQLQQVVESIIGDPNGRRHIITGWRPDRIKDLSLPCCHLLYQWYVNNNHLDMMIYLRSLDVMVGLPSDVILAAMWNILMADVTGLEPGTITVMSGDTHIYKDHFEPMMEYLVQYQANEEHPLSVNEPTWAWTKKTSIFDFDPTAIEIDEYKPQSPIKFTLNI